MAFNSPFPPKRFYDSITSAARVAQLSQRGWWTWRGAMTDPPASTSHLRCLPASLVKPDPPEDLRVSPIPGETKKLLLEWSPPGSWPFPEYFPLKYHIRYAQEEGSVTKTVLPPCCIPPSPAQGKLRHS